MDNIKYDVDILYNKLLEFCRKQSNILFRLPLKTSSKEYVYSIYTNSLINNHDCDSIYYGDLYNSLNGDYKQMYLILEEVLFKYGT